MPSAPDWRSASAYAYVHELSRREFAWEYLRRDPSYKRDYHAVAHRLAAHLCLLNAWRARAIGKMLDHAFTKRRAAVRFTNDEMFVAKSLPFDHLPATKRMVLREHDKQTLAPKRRGVAIGRLACIRHKCHIKAAFPNQRNVPH